MAAIIPSSRILISSPAVHRTLGYDDRGRPCIIWRASAVSVDLSCLAESISEFQHIL